jgi:hypothetical protein
VSAETIALVGEVDVAMYFAVKHIAVKGADVERLDTLGITLFRRQLIAHYYVEMGVTRRAETSEEKAVFYTVLGYGLA